MTSEKEIVELNVGGITFMTTLKTFQNVPDCHLSRTITKLLQNDTTNVSTLDAVVYHPDKRKFFIDRDGVLFRFILDFLRQPDLFSLPENFTEKNRLYQEARYYGLENLLSKLSTKPSTESKINSEKITGCITIGYRGTFAFGRDAGAGDVKFRKIMRILVAGKVSLCKEVFKEQLNESRDPDIRDDGRYTSRFFLKHSFLELAFDQLINAGFKMVGSCGSGTNGISDCKPGMESSEELKWLHYNEFVFMRC